MRTLILFLLALFVASPASAVIDLVSINHPTTVTVDLTGYGWSAASVGGDINSAVAAASAGDTIYVDTGTYPDTAHEIFAGNWVANDIVVIGPENSVAEITVTGSGGYAVTTPATATGCKVVNMTFRGTASGARALNISTATAGPFTLDNVTFDNTGLSIYHVGAGVASGIVVTNCTFQNMQDNPPLAYIVSQAGATDWTFSNNNFDFSGATVSSGITSVMQFTGIANLTFTGNNVTFPTVAQSTLAGMWISGIGGVNSDAPTITHNTLTLPAESTGSWRSIYFGGTTNPTVGSVDDIFCAYNTVIMPLGMGAAVSNPHYGIEIGYVASSSQTYTENFQFIGNRVIGGVNGILIAESAAKGTVSRNWTTGCSNSGIAAKDARRTAFTYNLIEDSDRGYYSASNGTLASNNFSNYVMGNTFRRCDAGIYQSTASYAANDSATVYAGNIFDACGTVATQNTTDLDFATWQAYTPAAGVSPAGLGSVDITASGTVLDLRAAKGIHGAGVRTVGGAGLIR